MPNAKGQNNYAKETEQKYVFENPKTQILDCNKSLETNQSADSDHHNHATNLPPC